MENNKYYMYRHVRLDTNVPFYIGIGCKKGFYETHLQEYKRAYDSYHRSRFWKQVIDKTDYKVEIIFETDTLEKVYIKEIEFIELYGRRNFNTGTLVNLTDGGVGVTRRPDEINKSISDKLKGKKFTQEHKDKIGAKSKGRQFSEETRKRMSNSALGKVVSDITKQKLSDVLKGKNKPESMKVKSKANARKNKDSIVDLETGIAYDCLLDACEATNYGYTKALAQILKKYKTQRFYRDTDSKEILTTK